MNPSPMPPETPGADAVPQPAPACPHCGHALTEAADLGWCPGCGYCRSLEENRVKAPSPAPTALPAVVQAGKLVVKTPLWLPILVIGVSALLAGSIHVGRTLPSYSYQRALWTTIQIAVGVVIVFTAQFFALIKLAPHDETLSFKDLFLPGRLWAQAFKRMPRYGAHVCVACWGLTLVLCSLLFIGGLNYWFRYLPNPSHRHYVVGQ
jgi:hypothetical protein